MAESDVVVKTLRSMGLTRAEAEVYLTLVLLETPGPFSAYQVAQKMGKDPANVAKTLSALERVGAVRAVQEKPRLFLTIFPREFTENLLAAMKEQRARVLDQFQDLQPVPPRGVPMALNSRQQAVEKASQLLARGRREVLLFADTPLVSSLGTALEALAVSAEVRVLLLCLEPFEMTGVETKVCSVESGFAQPGPESWIHLIIDRATWLTASFSSPGAENGPVGWWCHDPVVASVMSAAYLVSFTVDTLETAAEPAIPSANDEEMVEEVFQEGLPITAQVQAPEKETTPTIPEEEADAPTDPEKEPVEEENVADDEEGLTFLIQHEEEDEKPS